MPIKHVRELNERDVEMTVTCRTCDTSHTIQARAADLRRYRERGRPLIQDIFPYVAAPARELLVSGTCPKCWAVMFGAEDTSEDEGEYEGEGVG